MTPTGLSSSTPPPLPQVVTEKESHLSIPPPLPRPAVPGLMQDMFAGLLSIRGRTTEAIAQRRAALQKLDEVLGPDHPELQASLDQLAIDLIKIDDYAGATPILQRTYEYRIQKLGAEHPDTLERLSALTECLQSAELHDQAKPLLQHQLSLSEQLKGSKHEDTLTVLLLLAKSYHQLGDRDSAELALRRAQTGFESTLGPSHPKSLASLFTLFENLSESPTPALAGPFGEKLVQSSQQAHGYAHPLTIAAAENVSLFYAQQKNFAAAITPLRQLLAAFPKNQTAPSLEQARLQCRLVSCLCLAEQFDEALTLAWPTFKALETHLGRNHVETERAHQMARELYIRHNSQTRWGRFRLRCFRTLGKLLSLIRRNTGNQTT